MMSLGLELSRGGVLQATTLKAFVRGPVLNGDVNRTIHRHLNRRILCDANRPKS